MRMPRRVQCPCCLSPVDIEQEQLSGGSLQLARVILDETPRQWMGVDLPARLLALLVALDNGPLRMSELRDALWIPVATLSELTAQAKAMGLVEVEKDRSDSRQTVLALTGKGKRARSLRRGSKD